MYFPSEKEYLSLAEKGNLIPVYKEILADLETPVSAYLKMKGDSKYSFLLESVEGEEKVARYSFLAKDPELIFQSRGRTAEIIQFKKGKISKQSFKVIDSPLSFVRGIMSEYRFVPTPGLPRFCGGMVGFIGYDTVRFFENLPKKPEDDLQLPDIILVLTKNLVIFDHVNHKIKVVSCARFPEKASQSEKLKAYHQAAAAIEKLISELKQPLSVPEKEMLSIVPKHIRVHSNMTQAQFTSAVNKAKKKIRAGDIIQVVLSQRFTTKVRTEPLNIYRVLRSVNPSPYMYYLNFDDLHIVGSSPELLVRCEEGVVETRPIAGTRPRGKDEKQDKRLVKELLSDPKERAEHTMLVDLGRNDLGRVSKKGSVKLSEFMAVEKYSHVMHIVSNVRGILQNGKDAIDVLEASFPAGTVSGAPKIRAMEIIDELETVARGPYAGCVGYLSFSGNLDTCITIRTIIIKDGTAYIQAGAGIVADSQPKKEFLETVNKARAQVMAIQMAHEQTLS